MPYAVTHILTTIFLVDIYRHHVHQFSRKYLVLAALFALVPDFDVVAGIVYNLFNGLGLRAAIAGGNVFHGLFMHSFLWPLLLSFVALAFFEFHKPTVSLVFELLAFAWAWHIFLDILVHGEAYALVFWPFYYGVVFQGVLPIEGLAPLDAVVFLLWLFHEEFAHKIRSYF